MGHFSGITCMMAISLIKCFCHLWTASMPALVCDELTLIFRPSLSGIIKKTVRFTHVREEVGNVV